MHDGNTFLIMHPLPSTKKRNRIRVGQEAGATRRLSAPTGATHLTECAAITAADQTSGERGTDSKEIRSVEEQSLATDQDVGRKVGGLSRQTLIAALLKAERAQVEAEKACAARDHFLATVSHELRTPLTPVLMAAHLLASNPEIPVSAREALDMIKRNLQIEARFIDDLLDFTRGHCGKLELSYAPVDVHQVISRALEVTSDDVARKNQQVILVLEANRHKVRGDATRLQQVFWNLLKNAAKFTPVGGTIQLRSRNEAGNILVEVTDSGIGLDAEALKRIFAPFEQANVSIAQQFGGLGLGLAIAKAAVEAHEATLQASSPGLGRGATFTVSLPLASEIAAGE